MKIRDSIEIACPYCGERFALEVDTGGGAAQVLTSDCEVCCRPIVLRVDITPQGKVSVSAHAESE